MVSINSSSTLAIRNLQAITKQLGETQDRMTTGFKVRSAKDDASAWQTATTLRSEVKSHRAMSSKLDAVQTTIDVTVAGADIVAESLTTLKTKMVSYAQETDSAKRLVIMADINSIQKQIVSTIATAEYNGANWLNTTGSVSYNGTLTDAGAEESTSFTLTDLKTDLTTITTAATLATANIDTLAEVDTLITTATTGVDALIKSVKDYSSKLSSLGSRLTASQNFLQKIADVKEGALSKLVDADLEEEAAKASALQVKQQLAYQAVSMANASTTNILRLFQ